MPDVARLDEHGVLVAVETVSAPDHLTDPQARTVALPDGHDMGQRLGGYRYDFIAGCFLPVSTEPLDVAERETPGLVEGLVEFIEAIERELDFPLPAKTKAAITAWRRSFDGRRREAMTQANDLGAIANVPGASYRTRVNTGFQALASWHYGASAPDPTYPLMLWGDQSTGKVWLRDAANSAWAEIGLLGPPFVWTAVGGLTGVAITGDVKATFRAVADDGWVMMNDGSIGPAGSGATTRANADCADLFALLWGNVANTHAPLQDAAGSLVGRGASAAADWAANRRLVLPKMLGRATACAGWGADLSDRALGETAGAETHTLTTDEMPLHGHTYRASLTSQSSASCHTSGGLMHNTGGNSNRGPYTTAPSTSVGIGGTGGGQAHSIMSSVAFVNFMAKL